MSPTPPRLLEALLQKMFPADQWEEIEGDLTEDFDYNFKQHGAFRAKCFYILDVLRLIKLYYILKKRTRNNNSVMNKLFSIHLKYGLRSLYRQKLYQALNVTTLSLSFSCFMLIFLFVYNQYHKDNFLADKGQIMRLGFIDKVGERMYVHSGMAEVVGEAFPEVEAYARVGSYTVEISKEDGKEAFSQGMVKTDPGFLDIFQLELLTGSVPVVTDKELLISESVAIKLFGDSDAIGQTLVITSQGNSKSLIISGIMKDLPSNASFVADLVTFNNPKEKHSLSATSWRNSISYFKLAPGTAPEELAAKIPDLMSQHTEVETLTKNPYLFRSFEEIKQDPDISDRFVSSVDGQVIFIFSIVGLVILFLGIANYVNLLAALSLRKTQEVSIKKVMGASTRSLIGQQLIESGIVCMLAIVLSGALVVYLTPILENYLDAPLKFTNTVLAWVALFMIGIPMLLTLFAAVYPALLMSNIKFAELLKGKVSQSPKSRFVRNGLLTLQFTISTFLIIGTLTFVKQLGFIKTLHNTDEIGELLIIKGKIGNDHTVLRQGLNALPEIDQISMSSVVPGPRDNGGSGLSIKEFEHQFDLWFIDENYLDIMGLEMAKGDDFYKDSRHDKLHVLINEALADIATIDPVIAEVSGFGSPSEIIGIVKNFSIESAREKVEPAMFMSVDRLEEGTFFTNLLNKVIVKLNTNDYEKAIAGIEQVWNTSYPDQPFDIEFMDDRLDRVYTSEMRMGQLFGTFTAVAIVISCLGILGLLTYLIEVRMKELGIRKVLGAGFFAQLKILTSNLWKVMLISNLVAFPLSYFFLKDWLASFAHRTNVSPDLFVATVFIFAAIVTLSALWQVVKVNRLNPAEVLRNE